MDDGRVFRYARNYNADLTVGMALAAIPNEADIAATEFGADVSTAPAADEGGSIGDKEIRHNIVTGGTTITANEYEKGYLNITDGTGEGNMYKVKSNDANAAAAAKTVITIYDGLITALDNSSVGTLINSPWWAVDHHTHANYGGTPTQMCVGRNMVATTSGTNTRAEFLWVQTWGPALLKAGAVALIQGAHVNLAEDTDGEVQTPVFTTTENDPHYIGVAMEATAHDSWGPVFLQICP